MKTVGQQLQAAREAQKLSPEAAEKLTKIKVERLVELERDDFSKFASSTYARGFVRTYAKALRMDERKLLKQLDGVLEEADDAHYVVAPPVEYVPEEIKIVEPLTPQQIGWRVAIVLCVVIFGIMAWNIYRVYPAAEPETPKVVTPVTPNVPSTRPVAKIAAPEEKKVEPSVPAPVEPPAPVAPVTPPTSSVPDPNAERKLVLQATEESWVRVLVVRGDQKTEVLDAVLKAGEAREFTAPRFLVKARVPAAIKITVDGQDRGPLGTERMMPQTFMLPPP